MRLLSRAGRVLVKQLDLVDEAGADLEPAALWTAVLVEVRRHRGRDRTGLRRSASSPARRLLEFHNGQPLPRSGNVLDVNDPELVVQALQDLTDVIHVHPAEAEGSWV